MAVDLMDYVPVLKREVNPAGSDLYPSVTDVQWVGYLSDAFWEARLDGFLTGYTTEAGAAAGDITIIPISGSDDLDQRGIALIVLYAGVKVLRNKILNMNTTFRAKAGPVEFEQQNSATMLAEMLRQLKDTKDRVITQLDEQITHVTMLDTYSTRIFESYYGLHGGYYPDIELSG